MLVGGPLESDYIMRVKPSYKGLVVLYSFIYKALERSLACFYQYDGIMRKAWL